MQEPHIRNVVTSAFDNSYLNLILLPTERCNLRCDYCYEDFALGRMSTGTVRGLKSLLQRRIRSLRKLDVSWFGGEPLLAPDIIEDVSTEALNLAQRNSVEYRADITTNGTLLTSQLATRIFALGIRQFQITLDGPQGIHDKIRRAANGKPSFHAIWENLLGLRDLQHDFTVVLRIHFTPETFTALEPLIDDVNREFASDRRFRVFFKDVERLGGGNDALLRRYTAPAIAEVRSLLTAKLISPRQVFTTTRFGPYVCYASKANSLVVRSDGRIAKCTVALNDDRNVVGQLDESGELHLVGEKFGTWLRGLTSLDEDTLSCPLRGVRSDIKNQVDREPLPIALRRSRSGASIA